MRMVSNWNRLSKAAVAPHYWRLFKARLEGFEQPGVVEGLSTHAREIRTLARWFLGLFQPKPYLYDSVEVDQRKHQL